MPVPRFNSMTEGVLVLDRSGRVQLVNRSLQEFFALKTDVRGQTMMEAFRLPSLADLAKRLPQERIVQALELELPGVRRRWLEVNAAPLPLTVNGFGFYPNASIIFNGVQVPATYVNSTQLTAQVPASALQAGGPQRRPVLAGVRADVGKAQPEAQGIGRHGPIQELLQSAVVLTGPR